MFDDSCYMEPLHLAGRLIMENGGETCRVEETVLRMGHAFGFREVECFAVPSGLFVSYRKSDGTIETAVKRIRRKGIDLTRIDEVNAISRHLEQEKMSCQEVLSQLKAVERRPSRLSPLQMAGAAAMSTAGWSLMFGGGAWDTVTAFFVGLLIEWVTLLMDKFHMQTLVATLAGGFLAAFLPMAVNRLTGALVVEAAVAGALMRKSTPTLPKTPQKAHSLPAELTELETFCRETFGVRATITGNQKKGKITLQYYSAEELEQVYELLHQLHHD